VARDLEKINVGLSPPPYFVEVAEKVEDAIRGHFDDQLASMLDQGYLRHVQAASLEQMWAVVTVDQDESSGAERTGAMVLAPQELAVWFG
jgi:hypothetical protein